MVEKRKQSNRFLKNSFIILFHSTLSLMMIDWAMPIKYSIGPIGFFELSMILLGISFFGCMSFEKWAFFKKLPRLFKSSKTLTILLCGYILFGLVTLFYASDFSFAVLKYVTVLQMMLFGIFTLYYVFFDDDHQRSLRHFKQVTLNLGLTSVFIAIVAFAGYFTGKYTMFYQRISTIIDYNQYSTILLIGMVCLEIWLIRSNLRFWIKYGLIIASSVLMSAASFSSGSRRSAVLLCLIGIVLSFYAVYHETRVYARNKNIFKMVASVFLIVIALFGSAICSKFVQTAVGEIGAMRYDEAIKLIQSMPDGTFSDDETVDLLFIGTQNEISETLEGMLNGSGMSGRKAIWELAIKKIDDFDIRGFLFGGGASYSWDIYDNWGSSDMTALSERYAKFEGSDNWMNPHNLFLQDMLDGGLILLVLQIALICCIFVYIFKAFAKSANNAAVLLMMSVIVFVTLVLSCGKGMIAHKYFWIILIGLFANRYLSFKEKQKPEEK